MKKIIFILFVFLYSCKPSETEYEKLKKIYSKPPSEWVKPNIDKGVEWEELGIVPQPVYGEKKPSQALIDLGKQLFFDPRISRSGQIACVSCHHPDQNYTDNRMLSMGSELQQGTRNAPTVMNLSRSKFFFWDGRAKSLEEQLEGPFTSPVEMNTPLKMVVTVLFLQIINSII